MRRKGRNIGAMTTVLSVVMPVHNGEAYLRTAIESVLRQEFSNFELLCVDDGSTDTSSSILHDYAKADGRVRVIQRGRQGLVASLNLGLKSAVAPIVARMDADDICSPERFAKQFEYLRQHPEVWVVGTGRELIDGGGKKFHTPELVHGADTVAATMLRNCAICHPTVMMRRLSILELGGYREVFRHAEDYDLWLRVIEHAKIDNLPFVGIHHRIHQGSVSEKYKIQQRISAALALACHQLRLRGLPDPSASYRVPPDLWSDKLLDELIPDHVQFFRSMLALLDPGSSADLKRSAVKLIEGTPPEIRKQNKKLHQEALFFAASQHRCIDLFKMRTLVAAARLHPTRFLKSAFASHSK